MLKDYPIYFNETELYPPSKWEESTETIENEYQTEAGTDKISVVRHGKLSVSAQFRCHSPWLGTFKTFSEMDSFTLRTYDPMVNGYVERNVRMRDFKSNYIEFSENVEDTNGVWDVSFSLKEF